MKKYNAFTFVELLMVILVLGIIISLTMPLLQNLINSNDINRAYMKKAIHDVTDATNMVLLRERYLADFNDLGKLCAIYGCGAGNKYEGCSDGGTCANCTGLRAVYNLMAVAGDECIGVNPPVPPGGALCFSADIAPMINGPGIKIGNKSVMQFLYEPDVDDKIGEIYIDVNGTKKPNQPCQDRYKFILYKDRAVMDTAVPYVDCSLEL